MRPGITSLQADAHAKINLSLELTGVREDGYHTIETVMQSVTLCDRIRLTFGGTGDITVRTNLPYLPTDGRNLAHRAARAFFERAGLRPAGVTLDLHKRIPVGAGLAGGSTDAAAVLRLLDRAFGHPLGEQALAALAPALGADVAFCLAGGARLATGIGAQLSPVTPLPPCGLVIAKPPVSVSTRRAYELADSRPMRSTGAAARMSAALAQGSLAAVCAALENAFEPVIFEEKPVVRALKADLLACGALGALMSGSGSAVFGLFADLPAAKAAADALRARWREVYWAEPVERRAQP